MQDSDLLDDTGLITLGELCRSCGVEQTWVEELTAHGVILPADGGYPRLAILKLRKARRLEQAFSLNPSGVALALDLLDEIDRLRSRLARHEPGR